MLNNGGEVYGVAAQIFTVLQKDEFFVELCSNSMNEDFIFLFVLFVLFENFMEFKI